MSLVRKLFGRLGTDHSNHRPGRRTHLDAARAIELARVAAASDPWASDLSMTVVDMREGGPVWIVSTPNVGHSLVVEIDDATEAALRIERLGVR